MFEFSKVNKLIFFSKICLDLFLNLLNNGLSYRFICCFRVNFII